jgi:predicted AlkP superfamily phosphohydrolase/phosphomutase
MDAHHPAHAAADVRFAGRIGEIYEQLDGVLVEALDRIDPETLLLVMSDHGFAPYNRHFHVNAWLRENGYLYLKPGYAPGEVEFLQGIDWSRTRAYAIGINGLYVNQRGREVHGIVEPGAEREELVRELVTRLEAVIDPELGRPAIKHAYRADEVYHGPYRDTGPDIVLGYHRGWRGSNESALGAVPAGVFADNTMKWSGDHCMAADEVPGILLSSRPIAVPDPGLRDIAPTLLRFFGREPPPEMRGRDLFAPPPIPTTAANTAANEAASEAANEAGR